jgi:hypothetical protein
LAATTYVIVAPVVPESAEIMVSHGLSVEALQLPEHDGVTVSTVFSDPPSAATDVLDGTRL